MSKQDDLIESINKFKNMKPDDEPVEEQKFDLESSIKSALERNTVSQSNNPIKIDKFFDELMTTSSSKYKDIEIDQESANKMMVHMTKLKHGTYASVPLLCNPKKCPIIHDCWFVKMKEDMTGAIESGKFHEYIDWDRSKFPVMKPCPVEASLMDLKIKQYVEEHLQSIKIGPTAIALITKLAELDIYEIRANAVLAKGDSTGAGTSLLHDTVESINQHSGEVYWSVKEHPILAVRERIERQREKLMKQLLSTPEAKLKTEKANEDGDKTIDQAMSKMNKMFKEFNKNMNAMPQAKPYIENQDVEIEESE